MNNFMEFGCLQIEFHFSRLLPLTGAFKVGFNVKKGFEGILKKIYVG